MAGLPGELQDRAEDAVLDILDMVDAPLVIMDNTIDLGLSLAEDGVTAVDEVGEEILDLQGDVLTDIRTTGEDVDDIIDIMSSDLKETVDLATTGLQDTAEGYYEKVATEVARDLRDFAEANKALIEVPVEEERGREY